MKARLNNAAHVLQHPKMAGYENQIFWSVRDICFSFFVFPALAQPQAKQYDRIDCMSCNVNRQPEKERGRVIPQDAQIPVLLRFIQLRL
jgi:hypothetical protein